MLAVGRGDRAAVMARLARVVVPGFPHHITQRGSRRQPTFFSAEDYRLYLALLRDRLPATGVAVWAYCLMPNHVHLVVVPATDESLANLFGGLHKEYARRVNGRLGWQGHLWQERFHSCCMDERHALAAVRYVELNPVRAQLVRSPEQWLWSSVHGHLGRRDDPILTESPSLPRAGEWDAYLAVEAEAADEVRCATRSGRPAGDEDFLQALEVRTGRQLHCRPRGRPKRPAQGYK
jgi:putative transposase